MHTPEPQILKDERIIKMLKKWMETLPEQQASHELAKANFELECG
jgi:hypothetical protein